MVREPGGCIRVWAIDSSVNNLGLMQSHAGTHSCSAGPPGSSWCVINPCLSGEITGTTKDGVSDDTTGEGLARLWNNVAGISGTELDRFSAALYYAAVTTCDSRQFDQVNLKYKFGSTMCCIVDIANQLSGWTYAANQRSA